MEIQLTLCITNTISDEYVAALKTEQDECIDSVTEPTLGAAIEELGTKIKETLAADTIATIKDLYDFIEEELTDETV